MKSLFQRMKKLLNLFFVFILFYFNCNKSIDSQIRNSLFQTVETSTHIIGTNKIRFFDNNFEFKFERKALDGNTERNIKGYSGKFRIEADNLILEVEQVLCCIEAVEYFKEKMNNKIQNKIYGSRYVNCEYRNFTPKYLESINFNFGPSYKQSFKINQSPNGIQIIDKKTKYERIAINRLMNESDEFPISLQTSKTKLSDSINVKLFFKNTSTDVIFFSNDFSYGGYFSEDSLMLFDSEYYNMPMDWLIMPDMELSYHKLEPGEVWEYEKIKKSNSINVIYSDFNFIRRNRIIDILVLKNLEKGFMTTKQLYSHEVDSILEYGSIKLN